MRGLSILLVIVALMAGVVSCVYPPPFITQYDLTISSTEGGSVTAPGEGTFDYSDQEVVELVAEAEDGYRFVEWTGDVGTVANVNAASTSITMNGDYSLTANFEELAEYNLTTSSTAGGSVTTPGEGAFTYYVGKVVSLVASPASGYRFVNWTGNVGTIANVNAASTTITMHGSYSVTANFAREHTPMVAVGAFHTVGLKDDGTVVAVGYCEHGQCDVSSWTDIIQVAAGEWYTVGLKADGTVVAVGDNASGQCDISSWTDIIQVVAGPWHTVGLKADGTVVAVGDNASGQRDVSNWTDIIHIAAGAWRHTVGLKNDGTVVAVGDNASVSSWTDIIQVATGRHTVGLKDDGTVVAVGCHFSGPCDVSGWMDIIQIAAGPSHTVGLKDDGTVVAVGLVGLGNDVGQYDVGTWTNIIEVDTNFWHTVGVKSDGTVVAVGGNAYGQCDVDDWDLN